MIGKGALTYVHYLWQSDTTCRSINGTVLSVKLPAFDKLVPLSFTKCRNMLLDREFGQMTSKLIANMFAIAKKKGGLKAIF